MGRFGITAAIFFLSWHLSCVAEPKPVQVPVSTDWFGFDGQWSAVNLRIGSPQQWVSLFPNILSQETWVISASGCAEDSLTCITKRGGVFNSNDSSTWSTLGPFALNFQPALGDAGVAYYGLDTISIADEIQVPEQIVGTLNTADFFVGSLGLGIVPSNFTSNEDRPTFLVSMVENQSAIPSHSYGYTAGAHYRLKGVPCSLTLGGVDLNRITPNDVSFELAASYEPVVSINSITVSADPLSTSQKAPEWKETPLSLLESSQAELFTIDSSTPFLWLPENICDAFALALNLTYNETLELYLYGNETGPDVLTDWDMNFTFTLADLPGSSKSVDISLPYDAFNQKLSFPFPGLNATASSPPISYFPLRKASNNTQYTIGRVFLQEAYIAVDYGRNNFSISQARFANDALTDVELASITESPNSPFPGPTEVSSGGLSTGAKAGIGIGATVAILVVMGLAVILCARKQRGRVGSPGSVGQKKRLLKWISPSKPQAAREKDAPPIKVVGELPASHRPPTEVPGDGSTSRFELPGTPPVEMPAPVPTSYYAQDKSRYSTNPAELGQRDPPLKDLMLRDSSRSSASPSLPPYSPSHIGRVSVSDASPSAHRPGRGTGTDSSEISEISPDIPRRSSHRLRTRSSSAQEVSPAEPSPLTPPTISENRGNGVGQQSLLGSGRDDESAPSRSISRSSRFREEGIDEEPAYPSPLRPRKFSWEGAR